jgi:ABC-type dipeptide/oligopeptide/nickel transport system permease subunit
MRRIDPWFAIGLFAFFALLFVALFGERIAPYETIFFTVNRGDLQRPFAPGEVYPLGSDVMGRDLLSLVLGGARATFIIAIAAGTARVLGGLIIAVAATWWRSLRIVADLLAEIVSAVPATLVAVLIVLIFIRGDAQIFTFVGALLVTGWAGPYRIARAELGQLRESGFSESAAALGVGRLPLFGRHHLPHLVPILAVSTAQQAVASLVAVAELGVLGIFVGATKFVNLTESVGAVRFVRPTDVSTLWISEIPEWGGLLANGRGIENLWTTRWVILVPGVAFALAAGAMSAVGLGIARQYQRRNALYDIGSRGAAGIAIACALAVLASVLVPPRYAAAQEWAEAARATVRIGAPLDQAFAESGLRPMGAGYAVQRQVSEIRQTGPAVIEVGGAKVGGETDGPRDVLPVLYFASGGGVVDAPIVYASWGLSPADHAAAPTSVGTFGSVPSLGTVIAGWADDYRAVDVRGKIAVMLSMPNVQRSGTRSIAFAQDFEMTVANALKRGPAAIVYIDPNLPNLPVAYSATQINPYQRLAAVVPIKSPDGVPVIVLSLKAAEGLLGPLGLSPTAIWNSMVSNTAISTTRGQKLVQSDDPMSKQSFARDLNARAHLALPVARVTATPTSFVGVSPGASPRVLIWTVIPATRGSSRPATDALAAFVRSLAGRSGESLAVVAFDRSVDTVGNARALADLLGRTRWDTIVVLDDLDGDRLRFDTIFGDLVPMFDEYATRIGARATITRGISNPEQWSWPGMEAFPKSRATIVRATGDSGDVRADVAGLLGYIAGRDALGAPELRR